MALSLDIILFILSVAGAVYFGNKKKTFLAIVCIAAALIMLFLFAATMLLIGGID